ncbi:hypothetical protein IWX87_001502 [Polaromonas sp. CG_9.7]|nr:hypothetical protein [Polaromonas sp. CG_9.7]MBG6113750.1 hypothetical protein [Polaromonas sp. CG_9.2]
MRSRISSSVNASALDMPEMSTAAWLGTPSRTSDNMPAAEQISPGVH